MFWRPFQRILVNFEQIQALELCKVRWESVDLVPRNGEDLTKANKSASYDGSSRLVTYFEVGQ